MSAAEFIKEYNTYDFRGEYEKTRAKLFQRIAEQVESDLKNNIAIDEKFLEDNQEYFLTAAVLDRHISVLKYLAKNFPEQIKPNQELMLRFANEKNLSFIHLFYNSGANINLQHYRYDFKTIGHLAAEQKNNYLLAYLLLTDFKFYLNDHQANSPLDIVKANNNFIGQIIIYIGLFKNFIENLLKQALRIEDLSLTNNKATDNKIDFEISNCKILAVRAASQVTEINFILD